MTSLKSILFIFLPFAAGYYLSYLFRVINAVMAQPLADTLGLDAAHLGLLTSVYFLTFASVQLPLGIALDRFGPHLVQGILLVFAAGGALIFAHAQDFSSALIGRGLIGLGVAGALIAGLKALADCFPRERLPLLNGVFIACGAAGAITATTPLEWLLSKIDWRLVFELLAVATALIAVLILVAGRKARPRAKPVNPSLGLLTIYGDPRFWRLAPLSALCIGSAWALQGLWAAPWLAEVELLERTGIVHHLFIMAVALCAGALLVGAVADLVRRCGIKVEAVLITAAIVFIAAELAIICHAPLPSTALWGAIAAMGGATVLSYTLLADLFPREIAGRANAALNVLHIGGAFAIQTAIGVIVGIWPRNWAGHYPARAYQIAFLSITVLQILALAWFLRLYWGTARTSGIGALNHGASAGDG